MNVHISVLGPLRPLMTSNQVMTSMTCLQVTMYNKLFKLTVYQIGRFCISFVSLWAKITRHARNASTAPSRIACCGHGK